VGADKKKNEGEKIRGLRGDSLEKKRRQTGQPRDTLGSAHQARKITPELKGGQQEISTPATATGEGNIKEEGWEDDRHFLGVRSRRGGG